jgi:hypothetical protein
VKNILLIFSSLIFQFTAIQSSNAAVDASDYFPLECTEKIKGALIKTAHITQACIGKIDNGQKDAVWLFVSMTAKPHVYEVKFQDGPVVLGSKNTLFTGSLVESDDDTEFLNDGISGQISQIVVPGRPKFITLKTDSNLRLERTELKKLE